MRAKLRTVAACNRRDHAPQFSYYCLLALHAMVLFFTHIPFVVNHTINAGEVATTPLPFCNEPHRSHVLCVKAELVTTSTSWSQHHFVAIRNPISMCAKLRTVAASNNRDHAPQSLLLLLARAAYTMSLFFTHILFVVNHTINAGEVATAPCKGYRGYLTVVF